MRNSQDSENQGACGRKSEATMYGTRRRKKGYVGSFHCGLVQKPASMQEAMRIPEAKAAEKLETNPALDVKKGRFKSDVTLQAEKQGKTVHFANLMDPCCLKSANLAKHLQTYKGRVVLWGDNVKHEEGYRAVFAERGASASLMTAVKFLDTFSKLPGMVGVIGDAI